MGSNKQKRRSAKSVKPQAPKRTPNPKSKASSTAAPKRQRAPSRKSVAAASITPAAAAAPSPDRADELPAAPRELTVKRQAFLNAYFSNGFNGTQAAITAGFSVRSARSIASELLTFPDVQAEIKRRLEQSAMPAEEVLARLSEEARASMADFLVFRKRDPKVLADGTRVPVEPMPELSLWKARQLGKLHLIKKLKQTRRSFSLTDEGPEVVEITTEFELIDAHASLALLGKHHKVLNDRVEVQNMIPAELVALAEKRGLNPADIFSKMITLLSKMDKADADE